MPERSEVREQQAVPGALPPYSVELATASVEAVPSGYKRTEAGVIPEDWSIKALGEVLTKGRLGGNYPNGNDPSGLPLMKMGNLERGSFNISKIEFIRPGHPTEEQHKLRFGDVLFNTRNTLDLVGKVAIWRNELPLAYYNSNLMRLEFDQDGVVSNEYANYALNAEGSIARLGALATGTTSVAAIYTRDLLGFPFIAPPPEEQRAIATALSDADALIESLDRLIAKKRAIKQAAMQQLLTGQTRLPGFTGKWEAKLLGDVGTFYKGQGIRRDDVSDEGIPCIRYGEIYTRYGDCVVTPESRIPETVAETAFPLRCGDVVFAGSGETAEEIGMCVAYLGEQPAFAGGDIVVLRPKEGVSAYLGRLLNHPTIAQQKARLGQGDAVVHISARNLAQIEVHLPQQEEQAAIATVLSDMDTEIEALERRRDKARQIKQGMMQQLLTGRVRLVESVSSTEATI